jgi:hypothetical protein
MRGARFRPAMEVAAAFAVLAVWSCVGDSPQLGGGEDAGERDAALADSSAAGEPDGDADASQPYLPDPACLPADAGPDVIAHSLAGFRDMQAACNWSYGQCSANTPGFYTLNVFENGVWKINPGDAVPFLAANGGHPVPMTWMVRRWTSPWSGGIVIDLTFRMPSIDGGGNGATLRLLHRGTEIASVNINFPDSSTKTLSHALDVSAGEPVDFVLDGKGETGYDGCLTTITISTR